MSKSIIALAIIFVLGFVLTDAVGASIAVLVVAPLMLVSRPAWKTLGRAAIEMAPYVLFATLLDS